LDFNFGEAQFTTAPDGQLTLSLPLYVDNRGYYNLKEFHLSTIFFDSEGSEISRDNTFVPVILQGENTTIIHNVTLSTDSLLDETEQYLFNDYDLTASVTAGLNFADLMPAQISTNFTFPWGAPFSNFAIGEPSFTQYGSTQSLVAVPVSFDNHADYDLVGNIRIELYDGVGSLLDKSVTIINVPQQYSYNGDVEFRVPLARLGSSSIENGHFKVYFDVGLFDYGPLVISYD
jgi:hypothetical protein